MKKRKTGSVYIWNSAAGLLNAGEAVILSMIVTRTNGLADAGVLTLAFAVGNLMMTIGKFGVRSYQATDAEEKFSFSDYFLARVATLFLMAAASIGNAVYGVLQKGYSWEKAAVILAVCFIYMVEAIEDVFWGLYQQKQALDAGAKLFIIRWCVILVICIFILAVWHHLTLAVCISAAASLVVFCLANAFVFRRFMQKIGTFRIANTIQILRQCFPLFLASFFRNYTANAPKYAIDRYLTQEVQACYGFIAMPVFVVELLNGFVYQPSLVQMAVEWKERKRKAFRKRVKRQCLILAVITILCLAGVYLCGIPVLSFLYGTDLGAYQMQLVLLLLAGGMLAYTGYFSVLLTIFRRQHTVMYGYAGISMLSFVCFNSAVKQFGVSGAVWCYLCLMTLLAGFFYAECRKEIFKI